MKKILLLLCACVLIFSLAACGTKEVDKTKDTTIQYADPDVRAAARADQLAKAMLKKYIDWDTYQLGKDDEAWELFVYDTYNPFEDVSDGQASVWHVTSVMALTNRMTAITKGTTAQKYYLDLNQDLIEELAWFRGTDTITTYQGTKEVTMYGVNRANERNKAAVAGDQSVYDDQMWLIREFLSAYANTGDAAYLKQAEDLTAICLGGWDYSKDADGNEYGGITWGSYYNSKHTCSNAPLIAPLTKLAELYKGKSETIGGVNKYDYYLSWAKKVYDFTYKNLRNSDNTYGDAFWTERDTVGEGQNAHYETTNPRTNYDSKAYTYNTGAMISGAAGLYKLTNEQRYLDEGLASAEGAFHYFFKDTDTAGLYEHPCTSTLWFNLVLLTGYIDIYPYAKTQVAPYIDVFEKALDYAYDNYYYKGFLPRNYTEGWTIGKETTDTAKDVMDAASTAEMYAMLSQFHKSIK